MTNEEKIALKETEEEAKRRGKFKRIFPNINFHYYKQFFEEDRPLNYFLDAKLLHKFRQNQNLSINNSQKLPQFLLPQQP